jgi:hypothetical protein
MSDFERLVDDAWFGLVEQIHDALAAGVSPRALVGIILDASVTSLAPADEAVRRRGVEPGTPFISMMGHVRARELLAEIGLPHLSTGDDGRIARPFVVCVESPESGVFDSYYRRIKMPARPMLRAERVH